VTRVYGQGGRLLCQNKRRGAQSVPQKRGKKRPEAAPEAPVSGRFLLLFCGALRAPRRAFCHNSRLPYPWMLVVYCLP